MMGGALESFNVSNIKPIREMIYESMRQAIFDGELKPGDRLVEKDLAEKMRVSRTPIREALRKLETEGLIKHVPRKGVVVKGFSPEDIIEIYSIRQALEALAITYTVKNITEKEIKKLKALIEEMASLTEEDETEDLFNTSQEFNDILMRSCKMPRLIGLISTYREYLQRFRTVTMSRKERKMSALKDHREILQAVIDRDAARAKRLVEEHLQKALESYLNTLRTDEKGRG
ncbi:MAG: GntR family transcriptional regulator [Tepidanaerobacteraceae bacterium]|jgi:DNA-binding GntR family transcriptional regulator|nr:GntR family transcriptional regulator [Tepidanaerobacteraceae bacterium]